MENLKNNIQELTKDGESLVNNYLKLFGMRQSQRLATFLGVISTVFIISTLLLIIVVFGSFVLADVLNSVFESKYLGYLIVALLYLVVVGLLMIKIKKTGKPLFTNLYIRFVLPLLNVEINQKPTIEGLNIEREIIKDRIANEKKMLNAHTQLLKFSVAEDFLKVIGGLFTSKDKSNKKSKAKNKTNKE